MNDTKQLTAEQSQALIRYALTIAQKICHERFCDSHPMGQAEVCKATLEAIGLLNHYDTTARKDARQAAFREVIKIAKRFDQGEADKCQRCKIASEIVSTIEAEQEQSLDDLYWQQGHTKR